ncbi:MAG: chemotaxis protein CheC [Candidatus Omnitrophota bacterium]|nr:chemotaxis protein CheC [Candidatus Omnitrophota bacterium]
MQDEMDILREVGTIAAAHGGIALSEILDRRINLIIPSVDMVSCSGMSNKLGKGKLGIAVIFKLLTGLKGEAVFILDEKNAFKLISLSHKTKNEERRPDVLTEVGLSTLKEIGNIVTGAYLSAIGIMLKKVILTYPPTLISGTVDEVFNLVLSSSKAGDYALLIEAIFEAADEKMEGGFYLIISQESVEEIKKICKQMLEDINKK